MRQIDLADPNLPKLARRLGLPAMAGLSLNAAHQLVDAGFVALLGTKPLAVLSLMAPLAGMVAALGIGIGIGAASLTARALGAAQPERARDIAGLALVSASLLAALLCGSLWLMHRPLLDVLGLEGELLRLALPYLPVFILTMVGSLIQIQCDFLAIGRGASGQSLRLLALCFGLNIALDPVFIFGFGYGLEGAAIATLCAQGVTLLAWAGWFAAPARRPRLRHLAPLADIVRVGLPEAASVLATTLSMMALLHLALTYGSAADLAALGLALRLLLIVQLPMDGFALGLQPLLGHAFGARNHPRIAAVFRHMLTRLGIASGLCALVILGFAPLIVHPVTPTSALAEKVSAILRCLAIGLPAFALRLTVQMTLQARIAPWRAALLGLAPMGWLLWPLLALSLPRFGVGGLAPAMTSATLLSALLALCLIRLGSPLLQPSEIRCETHA